MAKPFLTAEWRKLLLFNYEIDPGLLDPYLPKGTELDFWKGKCYISLVGFMFLNTRLLGVKIPFHTDFEEVNLRFYVRYQDGNNLKRGVVFIREIVPKPALTFVANTIYGENYKTLPMKHSWKETSGTLEVSYEWKLKQWHTMNAVCEAESQPISEGSEEEFITEHYWGYTTVKGNRTSEYGVEHPRWEVYKVSEYEVNADFGTLYGERFAVLNHSKPLSAFLAEGSEIKVMPGRILNIKTDTYGCCN